MMFCIQAFDHEEGTAARWYEMKVGHFNTKEKAREKLKAIRNEEHDDESMLSFRITEVGSAAYYSQPTDRLEY